MKPGSARSSLLVVLSATAILGAGCFGKPNPRIASIVRTPSADEEPRRELSFKYDDNGRVEEVVQEEGDTSKTWSFTWDGALLVEVAVEQVFFDTISEETTELTWENGRLVDAATDGDGDDRNTEFVYDGQGRLSETNTDAGDAESNTTLSYADDGAIEEVKSEAKSGGETDTSEFRFERSEGVLTSFTLAREGNDDLVFEVELDDEKRLIRITNESEQNVNGAQQRVTTAFDYSYADDGLLERVEQTGALDNVEVDVAEFDLTYDDGDASGLDMSANAIFLFHPMFDYRGGTWPAIDNTTGVARLAFDSW